MHFSQLWHFGRVLLTCKKEYFNITIILLKYRLKDRNAQIVQSEDTMLKCCCNIIWLQGRSCYNATCQTLYTFWDQYIVIAKHLLHYAKAYVLSNKVSVCIFPTKYINHSLQLTTSLLRDFIWYKLDPWWLFTV